MKHSLSGSRSRRRRYHGNNNKRQSKERTDNCTFTFPSINPIQPILTTQPPPYDLSATSRDDYETFYPQSHNQSQSISPLRRTINRIRLVLGTILLVPGILIIAPSELFDLDDFLFYFKKGTLPSP